jgi:hypothetical protein
MDTDLELMCTDFGAQPRPQVLDLTHLTFLHLYDNPRLRQEVAPVYEDGVNNLVFYAVSQRVQSTAWAGS